MDLLLSEIKREIKGGSIQYTTKIIIYDVFNYIKNSFRYYVEEWKNLL